MLKNFLITQKQEFELGIVGPDIVFNNYHFYEYFKPRKNKTKNATLML